MPFLTGRCIGELLHILQDSSIPIYRLKYNVA